MYFITPAADRTNFERALFFCLAFRERKEQNPTNISGQKLTGVASFMLPLGLDYVKSNVNVMLMVAVLNY